MENAKHIHFNLDGMFTYSTLDEMVRMGASGIGQGSVTEWELYQVLTRHKDKTTFYMQGQPYRIGAQ